jgi:hypothetical protein
VLCVALIPAQLLDGADHKHPREAASHQYCRSDREWRQKASGPVR